MKPILAGFAAAIVLLAGSPGAAGQPAAKMHRVGIVSPLPAFPEPPQVRAFRRTLGQLGYVEGRDLIVEARYAEGYPERFPELCAELVRLNVDVLVVGSTVAARVAARATSNVPIVFAGVTDALAAGLVTNLARPGGNVTGSTFGVAGTGIAGKWVELLKEAVPGLAHVGVLFNSTDPSSKDSLREVQSAARTLKVRIDPFDANNDASLEKAFAAMGASGAQGLIVTGTAYFGGNRFKIVRLAGERRLPAIYFFSLFPEAGGLMSYGGSAEDSYRRAALQADKILKGARPGDLPVDQATKFEFVINLNTAKALGISIPGSLLVRADRVIE